MKPQEKDYVSHVAYTRALEVYCEDVERQLAEQKEALAIEYALFYEGKMDILRDAYRKAIRENECLADKTREECAQVCEKNLYAWNGTSDRNDDYRNAHRKDMRQIRAMKERL